MEQKILKLRNEGKSYKEIGKILGCNKSTICYYCVPGRKEKIINRNKKRRKNNGLIKKVESFKANKKPLQKPKKIRNDRNVLAEKCRDFQRREHSYLLKKGNYTFNYKDVLKKIGDKPKCYMTGREIDLNNTSTYSLDHIVPATRGGENYLENLGLTCREANQAKSDMKINEFLDFCKEVLEYNGYKVEKIMERITSG